MRRGTLLAIASLLWTAWPADGSITAGEPRPTKLIVVSWDGAADWVVDRLLDEGRLPHLAALADRGVAAQASLTSYPSKTAAGHAAIWTGAWPETNGVTGNEVPLLPRRDHHLLDGVAGFSSAALTAEPLYVTAAKGGKRVVVLSATQSDPPDPHLAALAAAGAPRDAYRSFSGFEYPVADAAVMDERRFGPTRPGWERELGDGQREAVLTVGDDTFYLLAYDDAGDPTRGLDHLLIRQGSRSSRAAAGEVILVPGEAADDSSPHGWSPAFEIRHGDRSGNTFFRLFELSPDGSTILLYQRTVKSIEGAALPGELERYRQTYQGFHDWPFATYESGALGLPLPLGGNGTAERRALELVSFDLELVARATRFAIEQWQPDLLLHYTPMSDSAGHTWFGALDPRAGRHDPALADRLWPYYARVFELQDAWLGEILAAAPAETVVVLVSDHGMAGIDRYVYVNQILAEAGLLSWNDDGTIDLARTSALTAYTDFMVRLNSTDWKGGIVPPGERETMLRRVEDALLSAVDPENGRHLFPRVFRPAEAPDLGQDGERSGDLLYDLATGYYPKMGFARSPTHSVRLPWGEGHHGFWPERRDMQAIFYAAGPGLAHGVRLGTIRHIDIAPTLAHLLGIPAPAQAAGRVLYEALEAGRRPPTGAAAADSTAAALQP